MGPLTPVVMSPTRVWAAPPLIASVQNRKVAVEERIVRDCDRTSLPLEVTMQLCGVGLGKKGGGVVVKSQLAHNLMRRCRRDCD